jgi:hypothetical protein
VVHVPVARPDDVAEVTAEPEPEPYTTSLVAALEAVREALDFPMHRLASQSTGSIQAADLRVIANRAVHAHQEFEQQLDRSFAHLDASVKEPLLTILNLVRNIGVQAADFEQGLQSRARMMPTVKQMKQEELLATSARLFTSLREALTKLQSPLKVLTTVENRDT